MLEYGVKAWNNPSIIKVLGRFSRVDAVEDGKYWN